MNNIDLRGTPREIQSAAKELIDKLNAVSKTAHFAERALVRLKEENTRAYINNKISSDIAVQIRAIYFKEQVCLAAFGEFDGEEMFLFDEEPTKKEATR